MAEFGLDVGTYGPLATRDIMLGLAGMAEEVGYTSLWLADHVVFPTVIESRYPYSPSGRFSLATDSNLLEPIATMGVLAGATERLRIGTSVLVMPYRNPVLLARMMVTLDVLSGGRMILGAGVGWLEEEFEVLDSAPFAARGKVTDEYLEIYRRICAGGEVEFQGEHYSFDPIHSVPGSVQRPHPPIWIGGTSKIALRRVAREGDGWLSAALPPETIRGLIDDLRVMCDEHDRSFDDLTLCHKLFIDIGKARPSVDGGREPGTGTEDEIRSDVQGFIEMGFDSFIIRYLGRDAAEQERQLRYFMDELVPSL